MQQFMCLMGQYVVFEDASELIQKFLGVDVSGKQIQRVSEYYGGQIDPIITANRTEYIPDLPPPGPDDITYVMMDGSMLCTREEKWKETKLGRIYHGSQNIDIQKGRKEIQNTIYVNHLGSVNEFCPKLERILSRIKTGKKVIIGDGAKWIWNWAEDNYPGARQILDYYHAVEKIAEVARHQFKDAEQRKNWLDEQKDLLLKDGVETVIENIRSLRPTKEDAKEAKETAIRYYLEHADRMMYGTYQSEGLEIGSGAMESANRSVIQERLKLSGQRWSKKGANAIANLRCYHKSRAWELIERMIKIAA